MKKAIGYIGRGLFVAVLLACALVFFVTVGLEELGAGLWKALQ